MKKVILILCVLLFAGSIVYADGLNSKASYIKANYPTEYKNTIRKHAIEKWKDDHEMVVYRINNQADAIYNIVSKFESKNTNILYKGMVKWSHDGYEGNTTALFKELKSVDVKSLIKFHCDWEMVEYYYDNQASAKTAY